MACATARSATGFTWAESRAREATELGYTVQPEVLIIGGGQAASRSVRGYASSGSR